MSRQRLRTSPLHDGPMTRPEKVLTLWEARLAVADPERIASMIGVPVCEWAGSCHEISLAVLRTGVLGRGRIARGWVPGVPHQHSWAVLGDDVYDPKATVVDPTIRPLLAGDNQLTRAVFLVDQAWTLSHEPHGLGRLLDFSRRHIVQEPIALTPATALSQEAQEFLGRLGPLDMRAWAGLAHGPMLNWPSREIIAAMMDTEALRALIPVDIRGMLTDRNPNGLYW
jgi:hypothetical protein